MIVAGEPSGDALAAELVQALREESCDQSLEFFGAGGARMAEAGVDVAVDMTAHSVIGLGEALKGYWKFRAILNQLIKLAFRRRPDVIVCVDFSGFNRRFARQIRNDIKTFNDLTKDGGPRLCSMFHHRSGHRGRGAPVHGARFDLLLSIFPFEKNGMRIEFGDAGRVCRASDCGSALQRGARNAKRGI